MIQVRQYRVVARLDKLEPHWVPHGGDWGAGVRFRCMKHGNHEVWLMFSNPCGGLRAKVGGRLYRRSGSSFASLSVLERLELGVCFSGWLQNGEFLEEVRLH